MACVTWFVLANKHIHGIRSIFANRPLSLDGHIESQENKKLCFRTASLVQNSVRGLQCKNKGFYIPETQQGRRAIKVYDAANLSLDWPTVSFRNIVIIKFFLLL